MPAIRINKTQVIDKPVDEVYASVRDFKQWPAWSPWLIMEPDCALSYADDGTSYNWDGKVIGTGQMQIVAEDAPQSIDYQLSFIKPWKSEAKVRFAFAQKDGGTEVSWSMDSKLPFFMFMMTRMMTAFVGMDYERGLSMLKDYLETGSVPSKLDFIGREKFDGFAYVGIETHCAMADIGPAMESDMQRLGAWREESGTEPAGPPFSIYKKWDMVKNQTTYVMGVPVSAPASDLPSGLTGGSLAAGEVFKIKHTGPYRHLGNAWSAGYAYARAKVFAEDKKGPHFEIYEGDPTETPENELDTVLYFPVKG
jgi:DNA gyrase inhibitor GyrI